MNKERLLIAARKYNIIWNNLKTKSKTTKSRKEKSKEKQLYGLFKQQAKKNDLNMIKKGETWKDWINLC